MRKITEIVKHLSQQIRDTDKTLDWYREYVFDGVGATAQ